MELFKFDRDPMEIWKVKGSDGQTYTSGDFNSNAEFSVNPSKKLIPFNSSRKLEDSHTKLQAAFRLIRMYYREYYPHHTLIITQSYRCRTDQQKLYRKGRTTPGKIVTNIDGVKKKGKHNYYPSKAIDAAVKDGKTGKIIWDEKYYYPLVKLAKRVSKEIGIKITSGGSWKTIKDYAHIEL